MLIEETAQRAYGGVSSCQAGVTQAASVKGCFHGRGYPIHSRHAYVLHKTSHFAVGFTGAAAKIEKFGLQRVFFSPTHSENIR